MPFMTMTYTMFWYIYEEKTLISWLFGIPNALLLTIWAHQGFSFVFYSQTSVNSPRLYQGFGKVNLKGVK